MVCSPFKVFPSLTAILRHRGKPRSPSNFALSPLLPSHFFQCIRRFIVVRPIRPDLKALAPSASPLCPSDVAAKHAPVTPLGFSLPKTFVPIRRRTASSPPKPISPTPTLGPTKGHCATSSAETVSATHPLFSPFVQARPSLQVEKRLPSCLLMISRR